MIVLRADFYGAALRIADLVPVLARSQVVVGPMAPADLRRAISRTGRARQGSSSQPELVDLLIRDLTPTGAAPGAYDAGALPLLAHALRATAERAHRGRLTVADYLATGGIAGAVAQTAEGVLATLTADQQELTRQSFLRLVNVDDDAVVTRRRSLIADLPGMASRPPRPSTIEVLDKFIAARLLIADADSVQISHETLLTAWPRLQAWVEDGRTGLGLHRQLSEATRVWQQSGADPSALLRGNRLAAVRAWSAPGELASDLTGTERDFLAASEALDREEASAVRRRARRRQQLLVMFAVIAVLATGLVVFGVRSQIAAARERELADTATQSALSRQVAGSARRLAPTDPNLAAQLSLVAYQVAPTVEARSALLDATAAPPVGRLLGPGGPTMEALSPDGSIVAVGNAGDGSVRLVSVVRPRCSCCARDGGSGDEGPATVRPRLQPGRSGAGRRQQRRNGGIVGGRRPGRTDDAGVAADRVPVRGAHPGLHSRRPATAGRRRGRIRPEVVDNGPDSTGVARPRCPRWS